MDVKRHLHKKLRTTALWIAQSVILASLFVACGGSGSNGNAVNPSPTPVTASITTQPANQSVALGSAAIFSVIASGDAPLTYQWKRNGVDIAGATSATYSLLTTQSSDADSTWSVVVGNTLGKVSSTEVKVRFTGIELFAGAIGGVGNLDGTGAAARFGAEHGIALDAAGNIYVADTENAVMRKVTPTGIVTTIAGKSGARGSVDGVGEAARFSFLDGVAVDAAANIYVADIGNQAIRKITPAGVVSTFSDIPVGYIRAKLAVDASGNIYLCATDFFWSYGTIYKITPEGVKTTLLAPAISVLYSPTRLHSPGGIAVDLAGNLYVTDSNRTVRIVTPLGSVLTLAGGGDGDSVDGLGFAASFASPQGIAVDKVGNVFVSDLGGKNIRKITSDGRVTTLAGMAGAAGSSDGTGAAARFDSPRDVAVDAAGNVYVSDKNTVRKIAPDTAVTTLAGMAELTGATDGAVNIASLKHPNGVAVDGVGNVYVADSDNNTVRKINSSGVMITLAGTAGTSGSLDGVGAAARFTKLHGAATDSAGNVYVIDSLEDSYSCTIRKITAASVVTTLSSCFSPSDAHGSEEGYRSPKNLTVDGAGNVYLADMQSHTVRKITAAGVLTTIAGTSNVSGSADGVGTLASFKSPKGVAVDHAGNVYVADTYNRTVRKIALTGLVTTLAGSAGISGSADGTGNAASFSSPQALAIDSVGNVYVADGVQSEKINVSGFFRNITVGNNTIRKITPAGLVTTIVGKVGSDGVVLGRLPGSLYNPTSLTIDTNDVLYVTSGNAVLKIQL